MATPKVYRNAVVFSEARIADAFAVVDGVFTDIGTCEQVLAATVARVSGSGVGAAAATDIEVVDLGGRFVAPGIFDAHAHLVSFGGSLSRAALRGCESLAEIREALLAARARNPEAPRLLGFGWLFSALDGAAPSAALLDELFPDVPVYLDSNDMHSVWVNSAALRELGVTAATPDPLGGEIARDAAGEPTGMLYETACTQIAWAYLREHTTLEDRVADLDAAFAAYLESGVTSVTEMALGESDLAALRAIIARDGRLPFPVNAHWIIEPSGDADRDLAVVARALAAREALAAGPEGRWLQVSGLKIILDGVIDACTAAMQHPYADGSNADTIWSIDELRPVAVAADRAGMQLAIHAIGDRTSELALDVIEHCHEVAGPRARRHRLEHLESVTDETIARMAKLGVVASMQPVHCDPAVLDNWKAQLGDARAETGFPWHKIRSAGVPIALGTDTPTAPHDPLPNLYIALTARSVLDPALPAYHDERVFAPADAIRALTHGGAYASRQEHAVGAIREGLDASFVVIDADPLAGPTERLLEARVQQTFVRGELAFARAAQG